MFVGVDDLKDLYPNELMLVWEAGDAGEFLESDPVDVSGPTPVYDGEAGSEAAFTIRRNCQILIERGHLNVWDYGWEFYCFCAEHSGARA
ncbi:MAG: hypothetical protein GY862_13205 [Gammaproteobacteria bacterium]|nr:hypothetical protein [Gammaproteobacteria bacterium]